MTPETLDIIKRNFKAKHDLLDIGGCGLLDSDFATDSPLSNELRKCKHLKKLILSDSWYYWDTPGSKIIAHSQNYGPPNKLSKAPAVLSELSKLIELIWGHTEEQETGIKDISFLSGLLKLKRIDLSFHKIEDVRVITELKQLKRIDLSFNEIKDITPLIGFIQKRKDSLRIVSTDTMWLGLINIQGNPLTTPPYEVAYQGNEAVLNYFEQITKHDFDYLYEAKMLIVGQPRAGKTTLRLKLLDTSCPLPPEDRTTRGIDISRLSFEIVDLGNQKRNFYYNVWDFAGQEIYQATHQFFLTHRSLYIIVLDSGKDNLGDNDLNINYWLQIIELLGGNSPILLLLNEKNGRIVDVDFIAKKNRFLNLKNQYKIDLNTLIADSEDFRQAEFEEFKIFKEDIQTELKRLPLVGFAMPKNWVEIRKELFATSKELPYITKQDYIELCKKFDILDYNKQMELSKIFHDLGVFLHFQESPSLEDIVILQNTWATDAVFAILDCNNVKLNSGVFSDNELVDIWENEKFPQQIHGKLVELLLKFQMCYCLTNEKPSSYIVPQLLPNSQPQNYKWVSQKDIEIYYKYDFMPKGLFTRLVIRLHKYIFQQDAAQIVWKTGVLIDGNLLDCPKSYAEIKESWNNEELFVKATGTYARDLLNKLSIKIEELNNEIFSYQVHSSIKSRWQKMIPCICRECKHGSQKYYHSYSDLVKAKLKVNEAQCKNSFELVQISDLLDGISPKNIAGNPLNIFISYSHQDIVWKNELLKHLKPLKRHGLIKTWTDKEIEAGLWEDQINEALNNADIFIFLLTPNLLASDFVYSNELLKAYSKFTEGNAVLIPLLCEDCAWDIIRLADNVQLSSFQMYPLNQTPITRWSHKEEAFTELLRAINSMLEKLIDKDN